MSKTLAICALIKDEAPFMAEWMEFHRLVGVSRFVFYDDESTDGTWDVVAKHDRGDVTVYRNPGDWYTEEYDGVAMHLGWHLAHQCRAFTHFSRHHVGDYWCAFIDPDEFLYDTRCDSLVQTLEPFDRHPCVVANWLVFGSNSHYLRPSGLTLEAYTRRGHAGQPDPYGRHIKPIVNMTSKPRWGTNGSHCPVLDAPPVDQHHHPNPWSMRPKAEDIGLVVNHYYHRSYSEACAKLVRGYHGIPCGYPGRERLYAHDRNEVEDTRILRFLPKLKESLQ